MAKKRSKVSGDKAAEQTATLEPPITETPPPASDGIGISEAMPLPMEEITRPTSGPEAVAKQSCRRCGCRDLRPGGPSPYNAGRFVMLQCRYCGMPTRAMAAR